MRTTALVLAYAAALALGTYHTFRPTFDSGFQRSQTETGDGMLNHYLLENSWLALTDPNYCGTLLSPPFFFPQRHVLFYSENLFGSAPVYWALRLFVGRELAYIWWQIVCCALNFAAFGLVARWLRLPHTIALAGAFLWGFAVVHADQLKHAQMVPRFYMPFAAYYAAMLVLEPSLKALNRALGAVFLQCLACVYTGWFTAVGVATFVPLLLAFGPAAAGGELRRVLAARRLRAAGVVLLWATAMAALFVPYIVTNRGVERRYDETHGMTPTRFSWLTGPPGSRWHDTLTPVRELDRPECLLFSGFAIYALAAAAAVSLPFLGRGARHPLWPVAVAGLLTAVLWVLLTMSHPGTGEALWRTVRLIPGATAIRVPARASVVVYLFGTLGALAWLAIVLERIERPWRRAAVLVPLLGFMGWEQTGHTPDSFDRRDFYPHVERAAAHLRGAEAGYVRPTFVPWVSKNPYGEVFGMWVGLRANVPVLNGYSGREPPGYPEDELTADERRAWEEGRLPGGRLYVMSDAEMRAWLAGRFRGRVRVLDPHRPEWFREVVVE